VGALLTGACDGPQRIHDDATEQPERVDAQARSASDAAAALDARHERDAEPEPEPEAIDWPSRTIYLVMPDRFANGDPDNDDLGLPGCFDPDHPARYHGGDLAGLRQRLDYLDELGVSALWSTPFYRQTRGYDGTACPYHGYWADFTLPDDGGIEPRLGDHRELEGLLTDLDRVDIAFMMDLVVNHAGDEAQIVAQRPHWFHDEATCHELGDPMKTCPFRPGSPDFAQGIPEVAAYLTELSVGWLTRYAPHALRMDTAKHVPAAYFRDSFLPAARDARPDIWTVAEIFDSDPSLYERYFEAGFDSAFHFPLRDALVEAFALGGSVDRPAAVMLAWLARFGPERTAQMVTFLNNHDVPRLVTLARDAGAGDDDARRYHLALVALFTLPGVPQIYYGDEVALYGGPDPDNRRLMPAWAFDAEARELAQPGEAAGIPSTTYELTRQLIALRRDRRALARGHYAEMWRQNGGANPNVWVFYRGEADARAVVAIHAGHDDVELSVPIAINTDIPASDREALLEAVYTELLALTPGARAELAEDHLRLRLPPQSATVWRAALPH
jgi:alpha-amylase